MISKITYAIKSEGYYNCQNVKNLQTDGTLSFLLGNTESNAAMKQEVVTLFLELGHLLK